MTALSDTVLPYWRLSGFYFLFCFAIGGVLPYWPLYLQSLGFNTTQIGTLIAVLVIPRFFSTYLWCWLADHTHKRIQLVRFTSFMSTVSFIAVSFSQQYEVMIMTLFVFSTFWSASLPQIEAMTMSYLERSEKNYALLRLWGSIGFIVAVLLFSQLFTIVTIDYLPSILLASMILLWLLTLCIPEHYILSMPQQEDSLFSLIKKPDVLALLCVCFLMQASHGPYSTFFTILLRANAYSDQMIGVLWAVSAVSEVLIFIIMHHLIRYFGLKRLLLISLFFAVTRWVLTGYLASFPPAIFFAQLLHSFTFGAYHAVAIHYIHQEFKYHAQGRGQALYDTVSFGGGLAVGSLASGYLWSAFGAHSAFLFAAALVFIAFFIAYYYLK